MVDPSRIALPAQAPPDAPLPHERILRMRQEWAHLTEVELRQIIAGYYGMVALADAYCGMVLDALDRLGIRDETLVVWTADHGDQMWEHALFLKFNMREASVHVPLLIADPRVGPGVRRELVEHVDVFPTICALAGVGCAEGVQGRSLAPLVRGEPAPEDWRDAVFSQIGDVQMIRTEAWKLNVYGGEPGELFHIKDDPQEFCNRIDDVACQATVQSLLDRLKVWEKTHRPGAGA